MALSKWLGGGAGPSRVASIGTPASPAPAAQRPMEEIAIEANSLLSARSGLFGPITLTPTGEGSTFCYQVETATKIPANSEVGREVSNKCGCGGPLIQFDGLALRYARGVPKS